MEHFVVRRAGPQDREELAELRHCLWPDASVGEHAFELAPLLAGNAPGSLPAIIFLAQAPDGRAVGFIEVDLRSHADGCNPSRPVGYVEGWYVVPTCRRSRIGAQLLREAEAWARNKGCREMASDTWLDNRNSQRVHEALGFEVVDRCVHYRKYL